MAIETYKSHRKVNPLFPPLLPLILFVTCAPASSEMWWLSRLKNKDREAVREQDCEQTRELMSERLNDGVGKATMTYKLWLERRGRLHRLAIHTYSVCNVEECSKMILTMNEQLLKVIKRVWIFNLESFLTWDWIRNSFKPKVSERKVTVLVQQDTHSLNVHKGGKWYTVLRSNKVGPTLHDF